MKMLRAGHIVAAVAGLFIYALAAAGLLDAGVWGKAFGRLGVFGADLFPPRMDILPSIIKALWETIQIAFAGTIIGFILSMPLAYFGNHVLFSARVTILVRWALGVIRTVPSIVFGIICVVAFGLGQAAGIIAVGLYTIGYLGKMYYEAFEAVDREVIEAVRSTGCSRLQLFRFAVLPEAGNAIISQLLFMFEYNIRASTIMGFVGAGGIGYYMIGYVQMLQYRHLATSLLATLVVVMVVDFVSQKIRARFLGAPRQR